MKYEKVNLKPEEKATLELRGLYETYGYKKYKMNKFEEYSLYADNKSFLAGDKVLTFTDLDGRLMALKPDVTLSIIKNLKEYKEEAQKFYYIENVYRENESSGSFKEIPQMGLEYIGKIDIEGITQVVALAAETLKRVNKNFVLEVSHMDFVEELLKNMGLKEKKYRHILKLIGNKNLDGIKKVGEESGLKENEIKSLCQLASLYGPFEETLKKAREISANKVMDQAIEDLETLYKGLLDLHVAENVQLDFSMINDIDYYNGVIFKGYLKGLPESVLAGGQYDRAMSIFGKNTGALGFALYLNEIANIDIEKEKEDIITIALPKGRLGDQVYNILSEAGYNCPQYKDKNRKLVIENNNVRYILVKPSDVAVYVEHHAADIGIVGKDILLETAPDVYELKDLNIGKCKMAVAAPKGYVEDVEKTLTVATKYVNVAKKFYQEKNRDIEIIKLNGSIELGPILGMSNVIVDIVETGSTLRENNLEVLEEFKDISARLIANKSSYKFKNEEITKIVKSLGDKKSE